MPIRSPKGRGAAYRSLWQWPLRSPRRLIGCLVVLVAVGSGVNAATGLFGLRPGGGLLGSSGYPAGVVDGATPNVRPAPGGPPAAPANPPARLPPVAELTPATLPPSQAPATALTTATRWTQAWARHPPGTTTQTWLDGLRPYTTEEFLGVLASVDPANVPASRVTGSARAVLVSPRSVRAEVPTDQLTVLVLVIDTGNGWRVAGYDRADSAQNPAQNPAPSGR
ncbi:MAG: hypothetical protein ACT4O0_18525 [Pseudonocardia sp.]